MEPVVDRFPVRVVVLGLVVVLILSVGAMTFLAFTQTPIPDPLSTISVGALTGTTALLARTQPSVSTPVTVTNTPSEPVPTTDTPTPTPQVFDDAATWGEPPAT